RLLVPGTTSRIHNRHVLLTVFTFIGHGHGGGSVIELDGPELLARLGIESAKAIVVCCSDEDQAAARNNWTGKGSRPSGILLPGRQPFGNPQRHLPDDISGVRIDSKQAFPRRFLARQVAEAVPARVLGNCAERAVLAAGSAASMIRKLGATRFRLVFRILFDPAR